MCRVVGRTSTCVNPAAVHRPYSLRPMIGSPPPPACASHSARAISSASGWRGHKKRLSFSTSHRYSLPFADETFDAVHASWLLEHVSPKDVVPILREARRVLRKNGTLYLCEVENDSLFFWPRQPLAEEIARALWEAQAGGGGDPIIGRKLYGLCTAAGFTHVEVLPTTLHIHAGSPAGYLHGILNEFSEILRSAQHALPERLRGRVEEACAQLMSLERDPRGSFTYTMFRVRARP